MYPATDTLAGQGRHQGVESELQGPQYMGRDASPAACPLEETGQSTSQVPQSVCSAGQPKFVCHAVLIRFDSFLEQTAVPLAPIDHI